MDSAVINLNSMLEAEAAMRQRARENNGVEDRQFNESMRVVVIDSSGRPQAMSMGELRGAAAAAGSGSNPSTAATRTTTSTGPS